MTTSSDFCLNCDGKGYINYSQNKKKCLACAGLGKVIIIDRVNHPPHYNSHPSGIECIEVVEHMRFNLGNAIKYIWRADLKGSAITDLEKARWYLDREISKRQEQETPTDG